MPVHADDLADARRVDLETFAIETDTVDLGVPFRRHADVAGRADLEVELLVGPDGEIFPAVRLVLRQVAQNDRGLGRIVEIVLDLLDLRDLVEFGNVERALVQGDAVRAMQARGDDLDLALAVLLDDGVYLVLNAAR